VSQESDIVLKPGQPAPDFDAVDHEGKTVRLSALLTAGPVVLYFYPKDFTRVCTQQACMFRDARTELADIAGAQVVGVNAAGSSHGSFAQKHSLNFPLLVDEGGRIAKAYGVSRPFGLFVKRVTFVIDTRSVIRGVFHHELSAERHLESVREVLAVLASEKS
jgi:peroxiredoxin Q/BCP